MECKVCSVRSDLFGHAKVLGKYNISFYMCSQCGFMQTESPYWLEEAYSSTIAKSDIGLISRNFKMANMTKSLILTCFEPHGKFVDYGGGYGVFVRLMRDNGFDFRRYDPLCVNLFSESFDADSGTKYDLLTAWEVFEHLTNPLFEIEQMLSFSRTLFFSTTLLPRSPKPLDDWWYYSLDYGQHVAFYSRKTLQVIADKFNLKLCFSRGSIHLLSDAEINPFLIKLAFDPRLRLLRKFFSKPQPHSLIPQDYQKITGRKLQ